MERTDFNRSVSYTDWQEEQLWKNPKINSHAVALNIFTFLLATSDLLCNIQKRVF